MISLIVPTYNEAKNLPKLLPLLYSELKKTKQKFEIVIVDDNSPDKTWSVATKYKMYNVRVIRRMKDRGLSNSVIEGFNKSKGDILGVIDADLSHPPSLLPKMIKEAEHNDIVIASRYIQSGRTSFTLFRKLVSIVATSLAKPLTSVKDPMTGYFLINRKVIRGVKLHAVGYKILLEILVKGKYDKKKVIEVPFTFEKRFMGKSKLGFKVYINYISHLFSLFSYKLFRRN
jgi:dolichol-phosphate mannosyltransferase